MNKPKNKKMFLLIIHLALAIIAGLAAIFYTKGNWVISFVTIIVAVIMLQLYELFKKILKRSTERAKIEQSFPDFLQLMASNLRAGMTIDRALLLSSRKEFAPLDEDILKVGKELMTGKEIERSLMDMAKRIGSERVTKTVTLIISGIRSGGNIAVLLEETAHNMRERNFVEKRAASNVLMYVIFIFFAVAIGAPLLFGLSSVLVEVLTSILANIPPLESSRQLPFTLTSISISTTFINWFAFAFLIMTNVLGSLVLGLVSKGDEKSGLKFMIPLTAVSLIVFFVVKKFLGAYFSGFFS